MALITKSKRGLEPNYTESSGGVDKEIFSGVTNASMETLYNTVKKSPEVVAAFNAIVEDIMSDGYKLEGKGKPKKEAENFLKNSKFYKKLANALYDLFITGNSYVAKLSVNDEKFKQVLDRISQKNIMKQIGLSKKEVTHKLFYVCKQKGVFQPKDLQVLKSGTMTIDYNEHGLVQNYRQDVGQKEVVFKPKEVIHLSGINIGGGVYGFTPLEPLLSDVATLIFGKEYAGKFFEGNGIPNLLINLPEAMGEEDRNYQALKNELEDAKKKAKKAVVTTGQANIQQIEPFSKEMQYTDIVNSFTRIILMALGVPPARVNPEKTESKGDMSPYEGYFKKINFYQRLIEEVLNQELFSSFGDVTFKFNRSYKIDELREANIIAILADRGIITKEKAHEMMDMKDEGKTPITQRGNDQDNRDLRGEDTRRPEDEQRSQPRDRPNKPDNQTQ